MNLLAFFFGFFPFHYVRPGSVSAFRIKCGSVSTALVRYTYTGGIRLLTTGGTWFRRCWRSGCTSTGITPTPAMLRRWRWPRRRGSPYSRYSKQYSTILQILGMWQRTWLLTQRSRVRIRHLPQWSWCAAGSLCSNVENLFVFISSLG